MIEKLINGVKYIISDIGRQITRAVDDLAKTTRPPEMPKTPWKVKLNSSILSGLGRWFDPGVFDAGKLMLLVFVLYILGALLSPVPLLYPAYWLMGLALVGIGIAFLWYGGRLYKVKRFVRYNPDYNLWMGIFAIGIVILLINYAQVGVPILNDTARLSYHNITWSLGMVLYVLGMSATLSKYRSARAYGAAALISIILSVPSGFATDFILFVFPVVFLAYLSGGVKKSHIAEILVVCLILIVLIKYLLLFIGGGGIGVEQILLARPAFTFYTLSIVVMNVPLIGLGFGMMYANIFLQLIGIPRILMGSVVGEMVVNMPRFYSSTLVGPFYLEFGIIGVIIGCILLGFFTEIPHKIYKATKNHFFLALYSIQLSILLVWIETGVIQYYLAFLFFAIGIWTLMKARKGF